MKKHLLTISAVLAAVVAAQAADKTLTVTVTNPSKTERRAVPVVIEVDDDVRSALVTLDGKEIPCQLDDLDDDGEFDELAFVTDMAKKEKQTFTVTLSEQGEPRKYENRTYGYLGIRDRSEKNQKHQRITSVTFPKDTNPYNYIFPHGAVMENDMVGFRVYADHRQSLDYYGHRNYKMDIAETAFYTTQEQRDKGYGEDVLYTGSTYGCGALHGWDGKKSVMFENVRNRTQTVVCEGPVRTILDITNRAWQPYEGCKPVDIRTRYILYYGHRDVEVQVDFSRDVADIPLSTGIVDIVEGSTEFSDKAGLRGDWGRACAGNNPKVYDTITVGLGIFVPKQYYKADSHFTDGKERLPNQAYVQVVGTKDDDMHYWFTCTCDIETFGFKDKEAWFKYLKEWKKELEAPAAIKIE
ncbi:MAG: DUF4861 domain-containing protein [Prevotella sp.]|nr:DUF4861 domain-containing protein [Prevotella sp.]MDY4160428.1 DUF4861 domain-containing protein [Prevotella sp.]